MVYTLGLDWVSMYRSEKLYMYAKDAISDKDVWPVFVPSYNRPNATILKHLLQEPEFPIILCIRREQEQMYSKWKGKCPFLLLDNVHDLSETRQAILDMVSPYYKDIFMLDDDINRLDFFLPSETKSGKPSMRGCREHYGFIPRWIDILKMWQLSIEYEPNRGSLFLTAPGYRSVTWAISNKDRKQSYNNCQLIQCIHINTDLCERYNIRYKPHMEVGPEDISFQFDGMSAGLLSACFTDIMYDCPAINTGAGGCENAHGMPAKERYAMYLELARKHYGNHPGIAFKKTLKTNLESVKFNWSYWRVKPNEHCD